MSSSSYPVPKRFVRPDGGARYAFVSFLMRNDSYLPGALVVGYALRKQGTRADRVCLVTEKVSHAARAALGRVFDHVVGVEEVYVPHKRRQERQDRPYMFTRMNALRLGEDGDLGFAYEKVVVLDADVLPFKHYDHLFMLDAPAGILNEHRSHFVETDDQGQYVIPREVETTGTWKWHRLYGDVCPHGSPIPQEITDRVAEDPLNLGINGGLFVLAPSMGEFRAIMADVRRPETLHMVGDLFDWPEMQYLTLRWSGQWTNVDLRFAGLNGYPTLSVLYGTHFGGLKPWQFKRETAIRRWGRYPDFQAWFEAYLKMVGEAYPALHKVRRLRRLLENIQELNRWLRAEGLV
jgi:glycogenin glucosyltransferase